MFPGDNAAKFSPLKYLLGPAAVTYLMLSSPDTKIGLKGRCSTESFINSRIPSEEDRKQ